MDDQVFLALVVLLLVAGAAIFVVCGVLLVMGDRGHWSDKHHRFVPGRATLAGLALGTFGLVKLVTALWLVWLSR